MLSLKLKIMTHIYNYEDYKSFYVDSEIFSSTKHVYNGKVNVLITDYATNNIIIPVPRQFKELKSNTNTLYSANLDIDGMIDGILEDNDVLYIHPNCNIPRATVKQKYKICYSPEKATTCVIPNDLYHTLGSYDIFINRDSKKIFYLRRRLISGHYTPNLLSSFKLGTKVKDIDNSLVIDNLRCHSVFEMRDVEDFLDACLVYEGYAVKDKEVSSKFIGDVIYGKLHNIVKESEVIGNIGTEENKLDLDIFKSIEQMLGNNDDTIVGLGLKSLAELDYPKYRNTIVTLLDHTWDKWHRNKAVTNTKVRFMLQSLKMASSRYSTANYTETINKEDFRLIEPTIRQEYENQLKRLNEAMKKRYKFLEMEIEWRMELVPSLKD